MSADEKETRGSGSPTASKTSEARSGASPAAAKTSSSRSGGSGDSESSSPQDAPKRVSPAEAVAGDSGRTVNTGSDEATTLGGSSTVAEVEEQRDKQLKAGKATGDRKKVAEKLAKDGSPFEQRSGRLGVVGDGRLDNMSRVDDSTPLFGHFVRIDFGDDDHGKDALKAVEAVLGEGNAGVGRGDYGVWVDTGELDEKGMPLTVTVMTRDEHAAQIPAIPFGALRSAAGGGRSGHANPASYGTG